MKANGKSQMADSKKEIASQSALAMTAALRVAAADYRHNCGRVVFRGVLVEGSHIEMRCPKCGKMAVYEAKPLVAAVKVDKRAPEPLTLAAVGI